MFPSKNDPNKIFRFRELERDDFGQKDIFCKKIDISKVFLWKKPAPYLTLVRSRHRLRPRQPSPERCRRQLRCRWWRQVHRLHDGVGVVDFCFFPLKNPGIHEIFRKMQPLKWKTWIPAKNGWFFRCSFSFWKGDMYIAGFHVKNFGGVSLEHTPKPATNSLWKKTIILRGFGGAKLGYAPTVWWGSLV